MTENEADQRIAELRDKARLSDTEFAELIKLSPAGFFRWVPQPAEIGVVDYPVHQRMVRSFYSQRERAWVANMPLEIIANTAYILELSLRRWLAIDGENAFDPAARMTFGQLVDFARKVGLDPGLAARLKEFNEMRNRALHRLLTGEHTLSEIIAYLNDPEVAKIESLLSEWTFDHLHPALPAEIESHSSRQEPPIEA